MKRGRIKNGWLDAGKEFDIIGENIFIEQWWTPVKFDDEEDPEWFKTAGVQIIPNITEDF